MKCFKTAGACVPDRNYMVDLTSRLVQIRAMVDRGEYFTINRARQYGKTTTLGALRTFLAPQYDVLSLDFQRLTADDFRSEGEFSHAFCEELKKRIQGGLAAPAHIVEWMDRTLEMNPASVKMRALFELLERWCAEAEKKLVLVVDEVDSATNNQVFLDFLALLRDDYLARELEGAPAFQSVILAGVTDIRSLRRRLRPDEDHKYNSPWNIAADFNVDMSFNAADIAGMLEEYEADHRTGMDIPAVARAIEDYTSGYPFLVSRICQLLDGDALLPWNIHGVGEIVRRILLERNTLFDSLMGRVHDNPRLRQILWKLLVAGDKVSYNAYDPGIGDAEMFGFVCNKNGSLGISNRIFETLLYNFFLSQEELDTPTFQAGADGGSWFVVDGRLDMERVLERYVEVYTDLYGGQDESFSEEQGRLRFLLFVRPIINGTGNYYIEAQTRDRRRMDLVIDYRGERFVVELKLWRGPAYHEDGQAQLCGYLDRLRLEKGYLLTYSFHQDRQPGLTRRTVHGKTLVEAFV